VIDPPRESVFVPVLLYHGLGDHPRSATQPESLFDSQLAALRAQGYTALTLSELAGMLQGRQPLPPRPILITFDDARIDSFERADPLLARHGMKATMFVPTARIVDGHPFFADWARIRSFAATGRWDLQSHGHHAHDLIGVDADRQLGSFLVNRQWLEDGGRLESHEEYVARLDADYSQSSHELTSRFPGLEPIGYAFPFSEAGQESAGNDPLAAEVNRELLTRYFRFGFVQDPSGYNELRASDTGTLLRRFSVPRDFDGEALVAHLARHHPSSEALAQSARMAFWRGDYDRSRAGWERLGAGQPGLMGEAAYYLAAIDYQRGRYEGARRQLQAAEALGSERLQADPVLAQRIRWETSGRLVPEFDFTGDSDRRESLRQGVELQAGGWGPLDASVSIGMVSLRHDGLPSLEGPELAAGLQLLPLRGWTLAGRAWQRRFDAAGDSLSFNAGLGFENDHVELRLGGGRQDVETLEARLAGIQAERYAGHATLRFSPAVLAAFDQSYARLDDGNERRDLSGRLLFRPRWGHGLGLGASAGWSDTRFQSRLYYSPEQVRWARGIVSQQTRWGSGWQLDLELGLGLADDALRGRRRTLHAAGRAGQAWGRRVRTFLDGRYGSSPGYEGWGFGGGLQLRF
jgi:peptidoglycan/xylan/chitin deacetylase (PgdA/CDA1 family)